MPKGSFVFNDPNQKNSYGFRILTAGIDLKRFKQNPVMLNNHYNSTWNVLGSWENIRIEKNLLLGDPVFDTEDEEAAKVAGKVERGFLNTCSMGITFNRDNIRLVGDEIVMEKCELYEVSIVAVPSNSNSIRLYTAEGELMKDEDVKELCLSIAQPAAAELPEVPEKNELNNPTDMNKITLSVGALMALGFDTKQPEQEVSAVEAAILSLQKERDAAVAKNLKYETEKEAAEDKVRTDAVELAIKEGKIPATKKQAFLDLGMTDLPLMLSTLEGIPAKQSLSATLTPSADTNEVKTKEDFQKLSLDAQLAFKNEQPDAYKKLFNTK